MLQRAARHCGEQGRGGPRRRTHLAIVAHERQHLVERVIQRIHDGRGQSREVPLELLHGHTHGFGVKSCCYGAADTLAPLAGNTFERWVGPPLPERCAAPCPDVPCPCKPHRTESVGVVRP